MDADDDRNRRRQPALGVFVIHSARMTRQHHEAGSVPAIDLLPVQREISDAGVGILYEGDARWNVTCAVACRYLHRRQVEQVRVVAEQLDFFDWCASGKGRGCNRLSQALSD